jgi:hypothetical protein
MVHRRRVALGHLHAGQFDTGSGRWYDALPVEENTVPYQKLNATMLMSAAIVNKKSKKVMPD